MAKWHHYYSHSVDTDDGHTWEIWCWPGGDPYVKHIFFQDDDGNETCVYPGHGQIKTNPPTHSLSYTWDDTTTYLHNRDLIPHPEYDF